MKLTNTTNDQRMLWRSIVVICLLVAITIVAATSSSSADVLKSDHYQLQPTAGTSFGGNTGSDNYKLVGSGGQAVIGNGSGGSYKLSSGFAAELTHGIKLHIEPAGLVAYYPMEENAGPTIHDASSNSNDGSASSAPTWDNGKIGKALKFANNYSVVVPNSSSLQLSPDFTISFWIKTSDSSADIIKKQASATNSNYLLSIDSSGRIVASSSFNSVQQAITGSVINDNSWHRVTYKVTSSNQQQIYVDGELEDTKNNTSVVDTQSSSLYIGSTDFSGTIDEVKFFDRAQSDEETRANFSAESAGFDAGLVIPPVRTDSSEYTEAFIIVNADAPYSLQTYEDSPLTMADGGSVTIPSVSGNIASPTTWQEGTTDGFGFTVISGPNGTPLKWASGTKYAAVPNDSTTFYTRDGFSGGGKDIVKLQYRLGASAAQAAGRYEGRVMYSATMTP